MTDYSLRPVAVAYLTQCADDNGIHWYQGARWSDVATCPTCGGTNRAGHLWCGSEHGTYSDECAVVAYEHALMVADASGEPITREGLSHSMSLVVNDHPGDRRVAVPLGIPSDWHKASRGGGRTGQLGPISPVS